MEQTEYNTKEKEQDNPENYNLEETAEDNNLPKLYSKGLILIFSGFFSVLFGAVLLLSNLKQLNEKKARLQVLLFAMIYIGGMIFTINSMKSSVNFSVPLNILGGLILNEYFWNRYIGKDTEYNKKNWVKPTLISLGITVPIFILLMNLS